MASRLSAAGQRILGGRPDPSRSRRLTGLAGGIFWLRDESMEDSANLPPSGQIADEIVEDLRAVLEQLEEIAAELSP